MCLTEENQLGISELELALCPWSEFCGWVAQDKSNPCAMWSFVPLQNNLDCVCWDYLIFTVQYQIGMPSLQFSPLLVIVLHPHNQCELTPDMQSSYPDHARWAKIVTIHSVNLLVSQESTFSPLPSCPTSTPQLPSPPVLVPITFLSPLPPHHLQSSKRLFKNQKVFRL